MKKILILYGLLGSFPWLSSSCFQAVEDVESELENGPSSVAKTTLRLTTRSATGIVDYPVLVLAYDADGNKSAQQILLSEADLLQLKLPVGSYRLSAITGYSSFVEPADYSTSDAVFSVPSTGYAVNPLFVGSADVSLGDKAASVEVVMSSRCASLEVSLSDLPTSVESASVAVAKQYGALGIDGKLSSSSIARVNCTKDENVVWSTGRFYVLPGSEAQTVLTITIVDNAQQYSYGYTVNAPLQAAVPYILNGTYKGGERVESIELGGSLSVESWKDPIVYNFEFGEGASADNSGSSDEDIKEEAVLSIPTDCSIWNGHVVAMVQNATATEADLLLVSRNEYTDVYSCYAVDHEQDAINLAAAYVEDDLNGWKIPSNYEVQLLKSVYKDDAMADLNEIILQAGGMEIKLKNDKNEAIRYLCDNAMQAIGFSSGSNIGKAGKSVKYSLRLVKKVHVSLTK